MPGRDVGDPHRRVGGVHATAARPEERNTSTRISLSGMSMWSAWSSTGKHLDVGEGRLPASLVVERR